MRRVVLVLATIALAILLATGVAQAIINGEPDKGQTPSLAVSLTTSLGSCGPIYRSLVLCPKAVE
jgi:hypothetical protein